MKTGEEQEDTNASRQSKPVCLNCLSPYKHLDHYCPTCGATVGQLSPYIPFVNIPFNYSIFANIWRNMWSKDGESLWRRAFYAFMILLFAPIMLIGIPLRLIAFLRTKPPGHCTTCGYNLTGNVSGICPECGTATRMEHHARQDSNLRPSD